ncbi:hypothetical protein OVA14_01545 [Agrococcus sp. SL85]|uniref:hypothetical protein n=1 Tax=Agrococcus sp. SL85 TaxID=2995141 RepID=UPI00226CF4FF|nr:hypothetical protein [Agrococcus sp. SL85]WAC67558.1 hypothetical protein OVA14_01545 [Agrococcus sp. SL85]
MTALVAGESATLVRAASGGDVVRPGDVDALAALWTRLQAEPERLEADPAAREWVAANVEYDALADRYLALLRGAL